MKNDITQDTDYFEGVDLNVASIEHPLIKKSHANIKASRNDDKLLDDAIERISKYDSETKN